VFSHGTTTRAELASSLSSAIAAAASRSKLGHGLDGQVDAHVGCRRPGAELVDLRDRVQPRTASFLNTAGGPSIAARIVSPARSTPAPAR
jgi:hypothetical protein